jgi:hypothetical protein
MTAINQLPARIANKINSITSHKLLRAIREARIRRNDDLSTSHKTFWRRDKIMLACIDRSLVLMRERRSACPTL